MYVFVLKLKRLLNYLNCVWFGLVVFVLEFFKGLKLLKKRILVFIVIYVCLLRGDGGVFLYVTFCYCFVFDVIKENYRRY